MMDDFDTDAECRAYLEALRWPNGRVQCPRCLSEKISRIRERKLKYWADPGQKQEGKTNTHFGGRGVYFEDPSGHLLEIITRPYGSA